MRKTFEEIAKSEYREINSDLRDAIRSAPKEDVEDGLKLLDLIEVKGWFGKLEYPVDPDPTKAASNIKGGIFHSMTIFVQSGKWRFSRTEFNKKVDFRNKKNERNQD